MPLSRQEELELKFKALALRENVLRMVKAAGTGHMGGALSAADIVAVLYYKFMKIGRAHV